MTALTDPLEGLEVPKAGRWCDPDATIIRRFGIRTVIGSRLGPLLAYFTGTEYELLGFLPLSGSTIYAWEWEPYPVVAEPS